MVFYGCEKDLNPYFSTFTDTRDNYPYETVTIGSQTWLAENLRYLPVIHSIDETSTSEERYFVYAYKGNNIAEAKLSVVYQTFGALYNLVSARNACPEGWRLPDEADWEKLRRTSGARNGAALRSSLYWPENIQGNNSSGLNLLPRGPGETDCWIWSSEKPREDSEFVYLWGFPNDNMKLEHNDYDDTSIASVRCIKK